MRCCRLKGIARARQKLQKRPYMNSAFDGASCARHAEAAPAAIRDVDRPKNIVRAR
jgi:hypothetical protein